MLGGGEITDAARRKGRNQGLGNLPNLRQERPVAST